MYRESFLIMIFLVLDTIPSENGITRTDEKLSSKTNYTQRYKKSANLRLILFAPFLGASLRVGLSAVSFISFLKTR